MQAGSVTRSFKRVKSSALFLICLYGFTCFLFCLLNFYARVADLKKKPQSLLKREWTYEDVKYY